MRSDKSHPHYFFGDTDAEHERFIRQAMRFAPVTERFYEMLELHLDVAMLVARIVGRQERW